MRPFSEVAELDVRISSRYPREVFLDDGLHLTLTPLVPSDWQLLERFLRDTPEVERRFFRRDMADPARVSRWCMELDYRNILPLLVWNGGRVVADGTLHLEDGIWTSHVGKMRLLVHPEFRRRGIGNVLVHELITVADELGLHKLVYECAEEQITLMDFLRRCDFDEIARLPDFIRDGGGQCHDMVLLVQHLA